MVAPTISATLASSSPPSRKRGRAPFSHELRHDVGEALDGGLTLARGGDDDHPGAIEVTGEELQQKERGGIRDMHVVEYGDHRGRRRSRRGTAEQQHRRGGSAPCPVRERFGTGTTSRAPERSVPGRRRRNRANREAARPQPPRRGHRGLQPTASRAEHPPPPSTDPKRPGRPLRVLWLSARPQAATSRCPARLRRERASRAPTLHLPGQVKRRTFRGAPRTDRGS